MAKTHTMTALNTSKLNPAANSLCESSQDTLAHSSKFRTVMFRSHAPVVKFRVTNCQNHSSVSSRNFDLLTLLSENPGKMQSEA